MSASVIIFDGLLRQFPDLFILSEDLGIELVTVDHGKEVIPKVRELHPQIVILDAFMPQFSGIELCRQIKGSDLGATTKVVLVADQISDTIRDRVMDFGCDLLSAKGEALKSVSDFIRTHVVIPEGGAQEEHRRDPRYEISGEVKYLIGDVEADGSLINGSKSGLLFSAAQEVPKDTHLLIRFLGLSGSVFDLQAKVVRSAKIKKPKDEKIYAVGAKFTGLNGDDSTKVEAILSFLAKAAVGIEIPALVAILECSTKDIAQALKDPAHLSPLRSVLGELNPVAAKAFETEDVASDVVRRMVLLIAQVSAFDLFVPRLEKEKKGVAPVLIPMLDALLKRIEAIEAELEGEVKKAVSSEQEDLKKGLNETSNDLYEVKVKLFFSIDQNLSMEGLAPSDQPLIQNIKDKVVEIASSKQGSLLAAKFDRRSQPKPEPPKEEKKGKKKGGGKNVLTYILILCVTLPLLGLVIWYQFGTPTSKSSVKIDIPLMSAVESETQLTIVMARAKWTAADTDKRKKMINDVVEYLHGTRLTQAAILDEKGMRMLVFSSAAQGRKRIWQPRILVK